MSKKYAHKHPHIQTDPETLTHIHKQINSNRHIHTNSHRHIYRHSFRHTPLTYTLTAKDTHTDTHHLISVLTDYKPHVYETYF